MRAALAMNTNSQRFNLCAIRWLAIFLCFFVVENVFYQQRSLLTVFGRVDPDQDVAVTWNTGDGWSALETLGARGAEFSSGVSLPFVTPIKVRVAADRLLDYQLELKNDKGDILVFPASVQGASEVELSWGFSRKFSRFVCLFQLTLAGFLTYGCWLLCRFRHPIGEYLKSPLGRTHLKLFLVPVIVHAAWILTYWPAAATNDSWSSLNHAFSLGFSDWQPYTYALFLLACINFGGIFLSPIIQSLAVSLLESSTLAYAIHKGLNKKWAWLIVILFAVSPGIGTHNTVLWKDILYSYAVCLLGLWFYVINKENSASFFPRWSWPLWTLFFTLLFTFRQNGVVFYLLIPIWALLRVDKISRRRVWCMCAALFLCFNVLIPKVSGIARTTGSPMHELRTVLAIITNPDFYSNDRQGDIGVVEEATGLSFKFIKRHFPHRWFQIWDASKVMQRQFSPDKGYTHRYNRAFVLRLMSENPGILLAFRFRDFFRTIGIEDSSSSPKNGHAELPTIYHGTNLVSPGLVRYQVQLKASSPSPFIQKLMLRYEEWSRAYQGIFSRSVVLWGLPIPLLVLFACLLRFGWDSQLAWLTYPHLASGAVIFLVGSESCWRYYYSIYVSLFMCVPLWLVSKHRQL